MPLITELKRRNVFKVGTAYLALGWIITEVTSTVAPVLRLPEWTVPMVMWVGVIGFPCALIFSWVYELTPEGLKRESEIDRTQSITTETGRKLDYLIIALLVLAIGLFAWGQMRTPPAAAPAVAPAGELPAAQDATGAAAAAKSARDGSSRDAPAATIPDDKSIAVLPFADMSAAKDQEYMSDGISEELLNLLAKIPELRVIARTSSFAFKGKELEIPEIARRLGVAHILEGSVRTAGNRVRITAQLIRASDGSHLWSETYDRTLEDIFAVQDEIAAAVVAQLKITLLGAAPKARQVDPTQYAKLLQARRLSTLGTQESADRALALLQEVLAADPHYAEAWVALAAIYEGKASSGAMPIAGGYALAREAADKALAIDPTLAIVHSRLANIAWNYDGDALETASHLERALALEPNNPDVLGIAANFLLGLGRLDTAVALATYRRDRDPVNLSTHSSLAYISLYSGRLDEAIAARRTRIALDPEASGGADHYFIGVALLLKGDSAGALAEFELESDPIWREVGLAIGYFAVGRRQQADASLQKLTATGAESWAYQIANIHAYRGEPDLAFEWLERAVRYKDPGLSDVAVDPLFANLHADPRWLPFLQRIGRAPEQLAAIEFDIKLP